MTARWDHRAFGTEADPVRQSALNAIASQQGCAKRYAYERQAEAAGGRKPDRAHWKPTLGTAIHAVIERALVRTWEPLVRMFGPDAARPEGTSAGWAPKSLVDRVDEVLREEIEKARGKLDLYWHDADPGDEMRAAVAMIIGALRTTVERAESIVGVEVPWSAQLDAYHLAGTMDLIYRRRGDAAVCISDWKSGERRLHPVLLDHGYQVGSYAYALEHGTLWPRTERATVIGAPPAEISIVHLRDFVPYVKKTSRAKPGDLRGPGWYASRRTSSDVARLRVSLKTVVGTVRMGRFLEQLGEQCSRCPFRTDCLTAGHELDAAEGRALARALDGIDTSHDGLGEEAA